MIAQLAHHAQAMHNISRITGTGTAVLISRFDQTVSTRPIHQSRNAQPNQKRAEAALPLKGLKERLAATRKTLAKVGQTCF